MASTLAGHVTGAPHRSDDAVRLYLVGHPLAHSLSPVLHRAAFQELALDWSYDLVDCETEVQARAFLENRGFLAVNVTMPYKPLALALAGRASAAAKVAGGANVLVNCGDELFADNVDGAGCVRFLLREGVVLQGAAACICGSGPTALAIAHAFARAGAARVTLLSRDTERARCRMLALERSSGLCEIGVCRYAGTDADCHGTDAGCAAAGSDNAGSAGPDAAAGCADADAAAGCADAASAPDHSGSFYVAEAIGAAGYADVEGRLALEQANIIVDATPLGMRPSDPAPFDVSLLHSDQVVLDVVYGHGTSRLVAEARNRCYRAFDGVGMLIGQAAETLHVIQRETGAFDIPIKVDPFSIMAQACETALQ